jgi:beta-glucosidase
MFIGYRACDSGDRTARYAFGHGLGYTTWEYDSIHVPADAEPGGDIAVSVGVRNTGSRRGREVVQVYASRADGGVERPVRWLAGFAAVEAEAGEAVTATVIVRARAFEHWDVEHGRWAVEPGTFVLAAGGSSAAQPIAAQITISR